MKGFALVGCSDEGKTTLGARLAEYYTSVMGKKVAVVKHAPHTAVFSPSGKDTAVYREAGAFKVLALGSGSYMLEASGTLPLWRLLSLVGDADLLIWEGTPNGIFLPWIKVGKCADKGYSQWTVLEVADVFGLSEGDLAKLATDIWEHYAWDVPMMLNCGKCGYDTCEEMAKAATDGKDVRCVLWNLGLSIVVDGKYVPLVPFMEDLYSEIIKALVGKLKGVAGDWREVRIELRRGDNEG